MRAIRSIAFVLLISSAAVAAAEPLLEDWRWARFGREDGLPGNRVSAIAEASDGAVWVGTDRGLARYDGWRWFEVPLAAETEPTAVRALAASGDGIVWAVAGGGLIRVEGERTAVVNLPGTVLDVVPAEHGGAVALVAAEDGASHALFDLSGKRPRRVDLPPALAGPETPTLSPGSGGALWVTSPAGEFRWSAGVWERPFPPGTGPVAERSAWVAENRAGDGVAFLWHPGSLRGIWSFRAGGEPRRGPEPCPGPAAEAAIGPDGEVVARFAPGDVAVRRGGAWTNLPSVPEGLTGVRVLRYRDNGDLWVGTDHGLYLFRGSARRWTHWPPSRPGPRARRIHEILLARDGNVWLATAAGVEVRSPDGTPLDPGFDPPKAFLDVTGLGQDRDGTIWATSGSAFTGARRLVDGVWQVIDRDADGGPIGYVHRVRKDASGGLWLLSLSTIADEPGTRAGAVFRVEDGRVRRWEPADRLSPRRWYDFDEGRKDALWFATTAGVARYRNGRWTEWPGEAEDPAGAGPKGGVKTIAADPEGGAFAGHAETGLARIESPGRFEWLGADPDSPLSSVREVRFDEAGRLWASVRDGLAFLRDGNWVVLGRSSGLGSLGLASSGLASSGLASSGLASSGLGSLGVGGARIWPVRPAKDRVYVGTLGAGVWILDTTSLSDRPPLVVPEVSIVEDDRALVRWRVYSCWAEQPASEVRTRARLDGGAWSRWSTDREVEHAGLAAGEHRLEVQAIGLFGAVGEAHEVRFSVRRPFFRRPGVLVPVVLLSVGLAILGIVSLLRIRRDERALRESEVRVRRLMEEATDAILLVGAGYRILEGNRASAELLGRPRADLTGAPLAGVFASDEAAVRPLPAADRLLDGPLEEGRTVVDADGARIAVRVEMERFSDGRVLVILRGAERA